MLPRQAQDELTDATLDLLGDLAASPADEQPQSRGEREIDEGEDHLPMLPDPQPDLTTQTSF